MRTPRVTQEDAVRQLGSTMGSARMVFVAVAYWCDDAWAICSGDDRDKVVAAADKYLEMWPSKYKDGDFVNGHGAEGYWVMEAPIV